MYIPKILVMIQIQNHHRAYFTKNYQLSKAMFTEQIKTSKRTYLASSLTSSFFSTGFEGTPVCCIGIVLCSPFRLSAFGAVIVNTPSEDKLEDTLPMSCPFGSKYFLTKCLEMKPCSSGFSSCFPSTTMVFSPAALTLISLGANCWTSRLIWNLSLSVLTVEPTSSLAAVDSQGR